MDVSEPSLERLAFSLDETARSIGVCRRTLYGLIDAGTLRTIKLGRRRLVPRDELERLCRTRDRAA